MSTTREQARSEEESEGQRLLPRLPLRGGVTPPPPHLPGLRSLGVTGSGRLPEGVVGWARPPAPTVPSRREENQISPSPSVPDTCAKQSTCQGPPLYLSHTNMVVVGVCHNTQKIPFLPSLTKKVH